MYTILYLPIYAYIYIPQTILPAYIPSSYLPTYRAAQYRRAAPIAAYTTHRAAPSRRRHLRAALYRVRAFFISRDQPPQIIMRNP